MAYSLWNTRWVAPYIYLSVGSTMVYNHGFFHAVGYCMVYTMEYHCNCHYVMAAPWDYHGNCHYVPWRAEWSWGCPMGSPIHTLPMVHDTCHGATMDTPPGVPMERSMGPSMRWPLNATMSIPWHTPWTVPFHGICHGTRTMGSTMVNTMALSVKRPVGDRGMYKVLWKHLFLRGHPWTKFPRWHRRTPWNKP